ncbi:MAG: hypothetical protein LBV18_07510 [Alistipes sp.]|jgi:beta-galactosidase|nr:hypothetical protein [Alistipes sp.]
MKKIILISAVIVAAASAAVTVAAQTPRHLDPTVVSEGKELPRGEVVSHDSRGDALRGGTGSSKYLQPLAEWTRTESAEAVTYKTRYKIPFGWIDRRQFLYLGGVSASFDVVINGERVGYAQTGGTPSEFDITDASREGANELEIVIYRQTAAQKLENGRPVTQPALLGEVYVLSQPRMRVRDVFADTRMSGTDGVLELGVVMKSHRLNAREYTVYYELLSPRGEIVAEGRKEATLDMRREDTVSFFARIPRVAPWSHEQPTLYTLMVKTQHEGRFMEYMSFGVGFRSVDMVDGGLSLNGVPLRLETSDMVALGDASMWREMLEAVRAEGASVLKLHGTPPSHEFYDLCDQMGVYLVVQADIDTHLAGESRRVGGNPSNDPAWREAYLDRALSMYHTSRNHPSVVAFSLAEGSANGINLYESYLALKSLERRRPVVYVDGGGEWNDDGLDLDATGSAGSAGSMGDVGAAGILPENNGGVGVGAASPGESGQMWAVISPGSEGGGEVDGESEVGHGGVSASEDVGEVYGGGLAEGGLDERDVRRFSIRNTRLFTPLSGEAAWKIFVGRRVVSSGAVPVDIVPGGVAHVAVPIEGVKAGREFEVEIEVRVERLMGRYVPAAGEDAERRVFRSPGAAIPEQDRVTVGRGRFSSNEVSDGEAAFGRRVDGRVGDEAGVAAGGVAVVTGQVTEAAQLAQLAQRK